jgi:hypothetical protein
MYRVSDVRQIEIQTAEPLVPDPSPFEFEIAVSKLKMHKSTSSDQISGRTDSSTRWNITV